MRSSFLCLLLSASVLVSASTAHKQNKTTNKPTGPSRSWRDYWKAQADRAKADEPDASVVIRRMDQASRKFLPESGNLGTQTALPFFSGADTSYGFANSTDLFAGMQRQGDCSLSQMITGPSVPANPDSFSVLEQTIPKFDRYLDTISGIMNGGVYAKGCTDPATVGVLEQVVNLGAVTGGTMWAGFDFYNPTSVYTGVLSSSLTSTPTNISLTNQIAGMLVADFNGDGKLDLAVLTNNYNSYPSPGQIAILINNGDGSFKTPVFLNADYEVSGLVAGNFGKGHVDLIATAMKANGDWENLYYTNNGTGTFSTPVSTDTGTTEKLVYLPVAITSGGALDVIGWDVTNTAAQLDVMLNNGSASFTSVPGYTSHNIAALAAGDLNNDGKLDLVATNNETDSVAVLEGNGAGTFTLQATYPAIYAATAAYITDVDGDGNQDIVIGIASSGFFGPTYGPREGTFGQILLGHGNFTFSTPAPLQPFTSGVSLQTGPGTFVVAKLNADAYPDVAVYGENTASMDATVSTYLGASAGNGTFTNGSTTTFSLQSANLGYGLLATADLKDNGYQDLILTGTNNSGSNYAIQTALNNGSGVFTPVSTVLDLPAPPASLVTGDFNGDGKQDIAYILNDYDQGASNGLYIALSNGDGTFQTPLLVDSAINSGFGLASADVNSDSKADLIAVQTPEFGEASSVFVYLGKGNGTFQTPKDFAIPAGDSIESLLVADFNKDSKMDMALIGFSNLYIYLGNNAGGFTLASTTPTQFEGAENGVAADFNHDGNVDIVTDGCCGFSAPQIFLGNGNGTMQTGLVFGTPPNSYGVQLDNYNGGNYPGVIFGNNGQISNNFLVPVLNQYANAPALTKAATVVTPSQSTISGEQGYGAEVDCMVAEVSGAGQPMGMVTVSLGTTVLATAGVYSGQVYSGINIPTTMAAGTYTLTVAYSGDTFNQPSSATVTLQVYNSTTLTLTATNPIPQGSTATLTATLTRTYASGYPTGNITFFTDGGNVVLGNASLVNGVAKLTAPTKDLPVGIQVLQVGYYTSSTVDSEALSPLVPVTVVPAAKTGTLTTLVVSPAQPTQGQTLTVTAAVKKANGDPVTTGSVSIKSQGGFDGTLGPYPLNSKGEAVLTTSTASLYAYPYTLTAVYNAAGSYYTSESAQYNFFLRYPSTLTVTATPDNLAPGELLTLSANVVGEGYESPTGTIQFFADGNLLGTATLNSAGAADLNIPTTSAPVGTYAITAKYGGDEYYGLATSKAVSLTVK